MSCTNSINPNSGKDLLIKIGNNFEGAVTFQDTGDTVTYNNHGLSVDDPVSFSVITTTTGIVINVVYYVVNPLTNTFQLAATPGGVVLSLTTNGTGTAVETFGDVTGLSSTTISEASTMQEITNKSSNNYREILDQAGILSMSVSGDGLFSSDWAQDKLRTLFLANRINRYQIWVVPSDAVVTKYWEGCFKIASMESKGELDAAQTFSLSLESSGAFAWNSI